MKDQPCSIGELRYKVTLASRDDITDPNSTNLLENYQPIADVWARITPSRSLEIIGGEQIESPFTHQIVIRWQPFEYATMFDTIIRYLNLPNGERRAEVYRVRNTKEWQGRFRFMIMDCELEKYAA